MLRATGRLLLAVSVNVVLVGFLPVPVGSASQQQEKPLWQIGAFDRSWREFAIAGQYSLFSQRFGVGVVFHVGKDSPDKAWPFIHPGPVDVWAGSRVHRFEIRFLLTDQPKGWYVFRVHLADTHSRQPPVLFISVNGHSGSCALPAGGGDRSLDDPRFGRPYTLELLIPREQLRQGENAIAIECRKGSWVQYDALSMSWLPGVDSIEFVRDLRVESTPFFIERDGKLYRLIQVRGYIAVLESSWKVHVTAKDRVWQSEASQDNIVGPFTTTVAVPESVGDSITVQVTAGREKQTLKYRLPRERKWTIFLAPSAHTDIGYTDIQPKCAERHCENLDLACQLATKYPHFKWNCEVAWQVENYLATRPKDRIDQMIRLAKENRIGVQALYCNMLTGLCSHEEICRLTLFAHSLRCRYGIPYRSAMINDVPTLVGAMPMVLAGSGIRYFSEGSNNTRAVTFTSLYERSPCWWEGPDGSRILMVFVPSYLYAERLGLNSSVEVAQGRVLEFIRRYDRPDYAPNAIFANGAVSDNQSLKPQLADVVAEWNRRFAYPKIILCHNAEFFEYVEKNFGDKLPVVRGSAGCYWEDGAASSARETALCRNAHELVEAAERLFVLGALHKSGFDVPKGQLDEAWRNCMLFDEHTWGAYCSISQPESEFTKQQWIIKASFAYKAFEQSQELLSQALDQLAHMLASQDVALLVFNPLNWERSDVVELSLPEDIAPMVPTDNVCRHGNNLLVLLPKVPACGYLDLGLAKYSTLPQASPLSKTSIESTHYRITFDAETGAIRSIWDKDLGRELIDQNCSYGAAQLLYVLGGKGTAIERGAGPEPKLDVFASKKATLEAVKLGQLGESMIIRTNIEPYLPAITIQVTAWNHTKRVDVQVELEKKPTYEKEALYIAFPFAISDGRFVYQEPCAIVDPAKDFLPGGCLEWFAIQHFACVADDKCAVYWSSPDSPLVCINDINRGRWPRKLGPISGQLYGYLMNNYWFTNYLAAQGGKFTFRFAFTSSKQFDAVAASRFGWEQSSKLITTINGWGRLASVKPASEAGSHSRSYVSGSLLEVKPGEILLVGAKLAERCEGVVLRLWNLSDCQQTAQIRVPGQTVRRAQICNLVEDYQGPAEIVDGTVRVPIPTRGLATVLIQCSPGAD